MRIETNTQDRKALAKAIGERLHMEVRYDGVPSYSYSIGSVKVERDGAVVTDDLEALTALVPFFRDNGWEVELPAAENEDADSEAPRDEQETVPDADTPDGDTPTATIISVPLGDTTVDALKNLTFMLYSKQLLLNHSLGEDFINIPESLIQKLKEHRPADAEAFGALLAEHGTVGFGILNGKIELTLPYSKEDPTRWMVYGNLMQRAIKAAKCAMRVKPELTETESEKYHMRSWLIRIGYGSEDLKAERKRLLRNLKGYSAFPNEEAAQKHKEKYAAIRKERRGEVNNGD